MFEKLFYSINVLKQVIEHLKVCVPKMWTPVMRLGLESDSSHGSKYFRPDKMRKDLQLTQLLYITRAKGKVVWQSTCSLDITDGNLVWNLKLRKPS